MLYKPFLLTNNDATDVLISNEFTRLCYIFITNESTHAHHTFAHKQTYYGIHPLRSIDRISTVHTTTTHYTHT